MSARLTIRPEAEADIASHFDWYEERKNGLGREFLGEIHLVFRQIEENPLRHAEVYRKARRALVRRFPFKVFYLFENESVEVIAVIHARREPKRWQERVP